MTPVVDDRSMKGRHALVTGGGRGIGLAVAQIFAAHGATVSLVGRTMSTLEEARDGTALGGGIAVADVTDAASVDDAVSTLAAGHGPFDILVNNAGAAESAPFKATGPELWSRMIAVNLTGTYNVTRAALKGLTELPRAGSSTLPAPPRSRAMPMSRPTAPRSTASSGSPGRSHSNSRVRPSRSMRSARVSRRPTCWRAQSRRSPRPRL